MSYWKWIGLPGALLSIVLLWVALGFPTMATSLDINKLTLKQAIVAEETYANTISRYLLLPKQKDPALELFVKDELRKARASQKRATDRIIELSE